MLRADAQKNRERILAAAAALFPIRRDATFEDVISMVTAISIANGKDGSSTARIAHPVNLFLNGIGAKGS